MQRRTFFKTLAAVAVYFGAEKMALARPVPTIALEPLEIQTISAGPPPQPSDAERLEGPFIITVMGLGFIIPTYYMGVRYNSEFAVHVASGEVLKNTIAKADGRFLEISDHLKIPILDHLINTSAMWPELDPDDEMNDELAGRARRASQWVVRMRNTLYAEGSRAEQVRAFHAAVIGKSTHYSDWPV